MRVFAGGRAVLSAPASSRDSSSTGRKVTGTSRSPGNAERVRALGAEPVTLGQQPARVWYRIVGGC